MKTANGVIALGLYALQTAALTNCFKECRYGPYALHSHTARPGIGQVKSMITANSGRYRCSANELTSAQYLAYQPTGCKIQAGKEPEPSVERKWQRRP